MKKIPFSYSILQYEHNPWLKERLNIGVLLFSPTENFLRIKSRGWHGRILAAYSNVDKRSFTEDLRRIETAVSRFAKAEVSHRNLFSEPLLADISLAGANSASRAAKLIAPDLDSSYRWADGGVGLCDSLEEKLEQLFERFVTIYDEEKAIPARSDDQVWSSFSAQLEQNSLLRHITPNPKIATAAGPIICQAKYVNGSLNVIQSLSFDLKEESGLTGKALNWGGRADAIRKSNGSDTRVHFVLGKPKLRSLDESFRRTFNYLTEQDGAGIVVTDDAALPLLQKIEEQMAGH